ncbi:MAG TPA: hypothetical protein VHW70_11525 [Edaphobacter sp.]|nr:hypothetical protein [Edaphobacter sp.]
MSLSSPPSGDANDFFLAEKKSSGARLIWALIGLGMLIFTATAFLLVPVPMNHLGRIAPDWFYISALVKQDLILAGVFLAAFCLTPALASAVGVLRPHWRDAYTCGALLGICVFLWIFVIHFGRWQFGGFDFNILIEMGWRQILGQRPYVDFPATTPPGFNLGLKFAFELFGANWDANLYFSAIFACLTFLWMYWLMVLMWMSRLASIAIAFAIQCMAMLTLCFWWYNNSVLILGAIFFLSCLAYSKHRRSIPVQASYVLSLALLSVMKPNIAGLTIAGGVVFLLLVSDQKIRVVLLTLAGAVSAVALLAMNHVSIPSMLQSYLSVAKSRGSIGARFGYNEMSHFEKDSALIWIAVLSLPLLGIAQKITRLTIQRDWRSVLLGLFLLFSLPVALYGLATNGEFRDVECTLLLAAGGVATFSLRWNGKLLRRIYVAVLCATIAGDLYYGAMRIRVYSVGPHLFFEWQDNRQHVDSRFLKNMRVSSKLIEVEREAKLAISTNPGPYFFGSRVDFNYAAFGLPSPDRFPAWWHPGTAFPFSEQSQIIQAWQAHRFQTLIFLKSPLPLSATSPGYAYYPQQFFDAINRDYTRDERYPEITIYRRRMTGPAQP